MNNMDEKDKEKIDKAFEKGLAEKINDLLADNGLGSYQITAMGLDHKAGTKNSKALSKCIWRFNLETLRLECV